MKKITKRQQAEKTSKNLAEIAFREFSKYGYAAASTERIVEKSGVTRGALYHHFGSKKGLFLAVYKLAQKEIGRRIEQEAGLHNDPWKNMISGCHAFLTACSEPSLQQIVVKDAPSVLEWATMREIDNEMVGSGLFLLKIGLKELQDANIIVQLPVEPLAHMLSGAMDESAVWIAQSEKSDRALQEAKSVLDAILDGLVLEQETR